MNTKAFFLTLSALFTTLCLWAQVPVADFTSNAQSGCAPIIVDFQDKSSGNVTSWKWDFGNGATSTRQNPSTSYFTAGTYTVKLTVSNASGSNTITKTALITVYDGPTVNFITDKTTSCAPGRIQFTDRSLPSQSTTNTNWFWDFGDGTISTEQNPLHVYRNEGQFDVFVKITNDKGCFKVLSKRDLIKVTTGVTPDFTNTIPALCHAPVAINFTNRSKGPGTGTLTYTWLFGDGSTTQTPSASHTYSKDGVYPVSLIVSSSLGCIDTLTKTNGVTIGGMTGEFKVSDTLCATNSVSLINTSTPAPASVQWEFPDGTNSTALNPVKTFARAGSYPIKLINQYSNCKDTINKTIKVSAKPVINFKAANTINCKAPFTVNFQDQTNEAVSYEWDFGDSSTSTSANPPHTYNDFGNYDVKLKAINTAGCVDSLTKTSFIRIQKPVISFKNLPARGCVPYTLSPVADINTLDQVLTYEWDFGDGGKATGQSPRYTYTRQGSYAVRLTITTSTGCTETFTLSNAVRVGTKPQADFTATPLEACASQSIRFTNKSSVPTDEYLWQFGDGGTSTLRNPTYQFTDTGSLNVTLIAYNTGCGDTLSIDNFINIKPPVARFDFRPDCNNRLKFTFTDQSIDANTWTWNFGDGSAIVNGQNPMHTFPAMGSYNVSLTVTNGSCSFTKTTQVKIIDQTPDFTATAQSGCKNFRPTFFASGPVEIAAYSWEFENAGSSTSFRPAPVFRQAGEYKVTLTTTDIYGCQDTRSKAAFIKVLGPTAAFSSNTNSGCQGLTATFLDETKTDGTNAIVSWIWDFGDSTSLSTDRNPAHKYDTTGSLDVKLIVQDAAGCMDSLTRNNYVRLSTLKAAWDAVRESCPKTTITFVNRTTGTYTSTWSFGDNTTSTVKSPTHAYTETGNYTIKLKVRDAIGCEDSLIRTNHLRIGLPVASFTANNLISYCTPFEAKFTNTSQFYNSFVWTIQSATSTVKDPVTYYTQTGTDSIKLIVTSPGGCKDTAVKALTIKNASEGLVTYGPLTACTPAKINLQAFEPINATFTWDFGDGNIIDTSVNRLSYVYRDFGKYVPRVILQEQCIVPLTGKDTIQVFGIDTRFNLNKNLGCDTSTVTFTDSSIYNSPVRAYNWEFGDGERSNQQNPAHFYKQPGNYTVRLIAETQSGCKDTAVFSTIKVVRGPRIAIVGDTSVCLGERVQYAGQFSRTDTSAVNWQWQFPNGNTSIVQNPELQLFPAAGNYQIKTLVTNSSGCMDSAFLPLQVHPIPTVSLPAALTTYTGATLTIPATYSPGVASYNWAPAQGLSCTNCPQPIATPKFSTQYTVTVTDANGCRNVGNILLSVLCQNANVFLPNTFSPNGDGRNDIFYVRGKGVDRVKSFRIFNRWGEVVFEKREVPLNVESEQYGWDGKYKSAKPHPDVYIYQVEVYCDNGEIIQLKGNVALIQ